nr:hypothetical protein CFP56_09273 [Quercus suber]
MPPRTALSTPLRAWRCPQCTLRSFTTSSLRSAVGPEHPQYIDVPQPPQPNVPYLPVVKGRLPVPRDVFAHAKKQDKASDAWIDRATKAPRQAVRTKPGSREEWKAKISAQRRQNLREGLKSLRERKTLEERILNERSTRIKAERAEQLSRPEREDERLTAASHTIDLAALAKSANEDPTREARLAHMRANVQAHAAKKHAARMSDLSTLYLKARSFIVSSSQLDKAIDEAFGTQEQPVRWGGEFNSKSSVWGEGKPMTVAEMVAQQTETSNTSRLAMGNEVGGFTAANRDRIRRIAEILTDSKMDDGKR